MLMADHPGWHHAGDVQPGWSCAGNSLSGTGHLLQTAEPVWHHAGDVQTQSCAGDSWVGLSGAGHRLHSQMQHLLVGDCASV